MHTKRLLVLVAALPIGSACVIHDKAMTPTRNDTALAEAPAAPPGPIREVIGTSVEGRPIEAVTFGSGGDAVLILGGTHGDEPKSVYVARQLIDLLSSHPDLVGGHRVTIVPVLNPDGYEVRRRRNANRVDLNRNFPTANWAKSKPRSRFHGGPTPASEPETRALIDLVERTQPRRIASIHSIGNQQYCNNYDGPASELARAMSAANGYRVVPSMGYSTPGSFGTWAGVERNIPTITLELPSRHSRQRCWNDNREALLGFVGAP